MELSSDQKTWGLIAAVIIIIVLFGTLFMQIQSLENELVSKQNIADQRIAYLENKLSLLQNNKTKIEALEYNFEAFESNINSEREEYKENIAYAGGFSACVDQAFLSYLLPDYFEQFYPKLEVGYGEEIKTYKNEEERLEGEIDYCCSQYYENSSFTRVNRLCSWFEYERQLAEVAESGVPASES
jgi:hypothetical protein